MIEKNLYRSILIVIIILAFGIFNIKAQVLIHPYNLDFEDSAPGFMPYGWNIPGYAINLNYIGEATTINPAHGKYCLELRNEKKLEKGAYGSVMQSIDVKPYRGKRFIFSAAVRTEVDTLEGSAHLWAKVIKDNKQEGFFDWMQDSPIRTKDWKVYEISGTIDSDASQMNFGLLLMGKGKAWIDKASIEFLTNEISSYDSAYAISKKGLYNLKALFKLYGYVRYFYAGDMSLLVDWEKFLINSIPLIEKSDVFEELLDNLRKIFKPIAPELLIYPSGDKDKDGKKDFTTESYFPKIALCWRHDGFPIESNNPYLMSNIVNIYQPQNRVEGAVVQIINAENYRGKKIKFICMAKSIVLNQASQGQLWIRLDKQGDKTIKLYTNDANPIIEDKWKEYSIEADVPNDASFIRIGLILLGDGIVWFDNAKLYVEEKNKKYEEIELKNPGFEQGNNGDLVFGWKLATGSEKAYYKAEITDSISFMGNKSLKLSSDFKNIIKLPKEGESFNENLNEDLAFSMPLTVFVDSNDIMHNGVDSFDLLSHLQFSDYKLSPNDRTSRLAIIAVLWNLIKHFSFTALDNKALDSVLEISITKSVLDSNSNDFTSTLKGLIPVTNDSQAKVWYSKKDVFYRFPFLWEMIDNKIIITKVYDSLMGINVGDEILKINNTNIVDTLQKIMSQNLGVNNRYKISKAMEELRSGDYNTSVLLQVKDKKGNIFDKLIERTITQNELVYRQLPSFFEINNGIFYVDLTKFDDKQLKDSLKQFISAKGIIFDLRGYSSVSEHFLGFFLRKPLSTIETMIPVYTKPDRQLISTKIIRTLLTPKVLPSNPKVIFLMNEFSSGNSETLLNIIKDYGIAEIIGRESSGTGGEIIQFRLGADYYAAMTIVYPLDKQGRMIFNRTIKPDIRVERTIDDIIKGRDEILENAYEYLISKLH